MMFPSYSIDKVADSLTVLAIGFGVIWSTIKLTYHLVDFFSRTNKIINHVYRNELPHMERALRLICIKMGIDYDNPPIPPIEI